MEKQICQACGTENDSDAKFCKNCAAKLTQPENGLEETYVGLEPVEGRPEKGDFSGEHVGEHAKEKISTLAGKWKDSAENAMRDEKIQQAVDKVKKKKKLVIIVAVVLVVILAAVLLLGGEDDSSYAYSGSVSNGPDLTTAYFQYCDSSYATLAADGSYLLIDTNPNDYDDYTEEDAIYAIYGVNDALGLPDLVIEKMSSTRALDGRQTEEYNGVEVSWSYHPDSGLEVIYSRSY